MERHINRRPDVTEKCCQVLEANATKIYIWKLEPGEVDDGPSWYLPHFPVVREVYGSATRYGGMSLNDTVLPGLKLQQDVFNMLVRFLQKPDRDVFPSHYGKERQAIPPLPVEKTRTY